MKKNGISIIKLKESQYSDLINCVDGEYVYCELEYIRDRSSFAGVALKISDEKNKFDFFEVSENKLNELNKYENVYMGCNESYIDSMKEIFFSTKRDYGIYILFLIYSDIRSSQIIFEDIMREIDININKIIKMLNN